MVKRTRSKRGGQTYDPNQASYQNQVPQETNWLNNSWEKISNKANNLYNLIRVPNQTPYVPNQTPYVPNQTPYVPNQSSEQNQEKPWYQFWGGRRRTRSRKNRRTCKKRSRK